MVGATPVDGAFERARRLQAIVSWARERAVNDPLNDGYAEVGNTARGDRQADARRKIEEAFTDLDSLLNHLAILDMAAAFEKHFSARLASTIGEARKSIRAALGIAWADNLVTKAGGIEGLAGIEALMAYAADKSPLKSIKTDRNRFAHGTDLRAPPTIDREQARIILDDLISRI
jgi:hypothetical protein